MFDENNCNTWMPRDFLRDSWEQNTGLKFQVKPKISALPELQQNIANAMANFNLFADNRLLMGSFRYGEVDKQDFGNYNLIQECVNKIILFQNDGNLEHIIDAANMLRLKFYWCYKKGTHEFKSIDDGKHTPKC